MTTRVLVTGAGGPSGVAVIRTLLGETGIEVLAADIDPLAAGLYLVEAGCRVLLPRGDAPGFAATLLDLCRSARVDVLVPTVDTELLPLAGVRADLAVDGTRLALAPAAALAGALDKHTLIRRCAGRVRTPRTEVLRPGVDPSSWTYPVVTKPRRGSGGRGFALVSSATALDAAARVGTGAMVVQEFLPGEEFSIDVMSDLDGRVVAVVPRARLRVDSGVSVAGRTLHDAELDRLARAVVTTLGLTLVANVQCRRDAAGRATLIEVNPRFPGASPLTVHSGVNLPRLCLDAVLGRPLPPVVAHRDEIMVRFLEERFPEPAEIPVAR